MHLLWTAFASGRWQQWTDQIRSLDLEKIQALLDRFSALGPLPGILLPLTESLLPFLPLVVFVVANALSYGMWLGFLYSWIGVCIGSLFVFLLARGIGRRYSDRIRRRFPRMDTFFGWIETRGFTPIFVLACFPFSPSALVNIASGMSKIPLHTFMIAVVMGKAVMIFTLSFLGHDLYALVHQPWRLVVAGGILVLLWLLGKKLEARYVGSEAKK
ncbi:TVP38/TMEM64 family protein [Cohnella sp. REN36]|uniref:TVP38/TMEM64 family protein n=1 Tax=Cohnella sp. REN36 TaxID=2887347 RepID=UPI001D158C1C|nr:TVP38/TMEM64 family protein [Cohnella sp. REN36]MCC3374765.1 TVP38/TMEM64 family protein [Cohnella sp. REN36]